ncbi:hypothetical protein J4E90_000431 [Alternaria incomplexa]|uniref:uncharacterized protein n=1 Tax=Alternaria incomplexa TaxID=1187928 RepID=UPI00221F4480|nr:uncharacterized protein J4E90_000431 [Alternaria incomplexa]KAI4922003.1 hypothetical protein J4E90_000431 [Alternaria incomplexa]
MAPPNEQPAKRRKLLPQGSADSRDLLDVGSEILIVKVGGGDDPVEPNVAGENCDKPEHSNESDDSDTDSDVSEERIFHIHKGVLCKTSAFFRNATKPEWTAPTPRPIDLSDERPDIFYLYVQWLYNGKIAVETMSSSDSDAEVRKHENVNFHSLIQSYILGEKLMDTTFQNSVLKCLIECVKQEDNFPSDLTVKLAYERTTKHSPLRKLLVDFWVWYGCSDWAADDMNEDLGTEFTNDLLKAVLKVRAGPDEEKDRVEPPWLAHPETYSIKDNMETTKGTSNSGGIKARGECVSKRY